MYKSPQEIETNLINDNKSCYLVLILESHSKRLLLSLLSYPDVNTIRKLSDLSHDKNILESARYLWIWPQFKSRDSRITRFHYCLWIPVQKECYNGGIVNISRVLVNSLLLADNTYVHSTQCYREILLFLCLASRVISRIPRVDFHLHCSVLKFQ